MILSWGALGHLGFCRLTRLVRIVRLKGFIKAQQFTGLTGPVMFRSFLLLNIGYRIQAFGRPEALNRPSPKP